jgi:hypothetical protein
MVSSLLNTGWRNEMKWISVEDRLPSIGEKVILFANGVVQEEIFVMDEADISDYTTIRFWGRDDLENCPKVESGQRWMPLPEPPEE